MNELTRLVCSEVARVRNDLAFYEEFYSDKAVAAGKNQFLFFIKPELTVESSSIKFNKILDLILEKLDAFGLKIHSARIVSAKYLEKFNIIDQHYGVIGNISNHGAGGMTDAAKKRFEEIFQVPAHKAILLGGMEFLRKYDFFEPHSLDCLWQNQEIVRIASGTYCEKIKIDNDTVYLLNGFHPKQLGNYTTKGRSVVVFYISGDVSWSDARKYFAGVTDPVKAAEGSIRRELYDRCDELGIREVSQSFNGIHLSAGPVEALTELRRFCSDFSAPDRNVNIIDFPFGKSLSELFNGNPEFVLDNPVLDVSGKRISVFDLTEEKDSYEALRLLEQYAMPLAGR